MSYIIEFPRIPSCAEIRLMTDESFNALRKRFYSYCDNAIAAVAVLTCDLPYSIEKDTKSAIDIVVRHYRDSVEVAYDVVDWAIKVRYTDYREEFQK
jgi:hypothetical protein